MRAVNFVKRNSATILTCTGAVGVVATSVLTAKATIKAVDILEAAQKEKGEELTRSEKIQVAAPIYIPPALLGIGTITCIFGANILNKRTQASLVSAYSLLDRSYKEYKDTVNDIYGEDADATIEKEMIKEQHPRRRKTDISDISNVFR